YLEDLRQPTLVRLHRLLCFDSPRDVLENPFIEDGCPVGRSLHVSGVPCPDYRTLRASHLYFEIEDRSLALHLLAPPKPISRIYVEGCSGPREQRFKIRKAEHGNHCRVGVDQSS